MKSPNYWRSKQLQQKLTGSKETPYWTISSPYNWGESTWIRLVMEEKFPWTSWTPFFVAGCLDDFGCAINGPVMAWNLFYKECSLP